MIKKILLFVISLIFVQNISNAQAPLTVSVSGPNAICSGNTLTLNAAASDSTASFSWTGPNNYTNTGNTISINNIDTGASGTYYVYATSGGIYSNPDSIIVAVSQTPDVYPVVNQNVCQGTATTAVTFNGSFNGIATYYWTNDDTAIGLSSGNTGDIPSFTATNSGNTSILANITVTPVGNGCTGISQSFSITVNALPAINTHPASASICEYSTVDFAVSASGSNLAYQWQVDTGAGFNNLNDGGFYGGSTSSMLEINATPALLSGFSYRCSVSGTCGSVMNSNAATLTVNTLPSINLQSPANTICEGANTNYSVSATGSGLTYQWQVNAGSGYTNVSNGGVYSGATSNTLNISGATSTMDGHLYQCVVSGTCSPVLTSIGTLLTVNALPAIVSQPVDAAICSGANATYTISASGSAITYQWQLNTGSGFVNVADLGAYYGSTTNTLHIYGATTAMSGNLFRCFISGVCAPPATSNTVSLSFNPTPAASISANGPTTFCDGSSVILHTPSGANYTYQWALNGNSLGGVNSSSYMAAAGGNYVVTSTNVFGCSATSNSFIVTVNPTPAAPVNVIAGTLVFCDGGNVVLGTNSNNGLSYQWKNNGVNIPGATNMNYVATTAGNYSVFVSDNNCSATSNAVSTIVNPMPPSTLTVNNPAIICSSVGNLLISSVAVSGQTYQWYENGLLVPGANAPQYTATAGGWYNVQITNASCVAFTNSVYVTYSNSPIPVISEQGGVLSAGSYASYQWYFNGSAINGANSANYAATQNGTYSVSVTNADGCSGSSTNYILSDLAVNNISSEANNVTIYPNPAESVVHIDAPASVNVIIYSLTGKEIVRSYGAKQIDLGTVPAGIYMLQVYAEDGTLIKTEKLVKSEW